MELENKDDKQVEVERGKRRTAFRFEMIALLDVLIVLCAIFWGNLETSTLTALTGFGTTVFLVSLGYSGSLRGLDVVQFIGKK